MRLLTALPFAALAPATRILTGLPIVALSLVAMPLAGLAAGTEDPAPPTPTETSQKCEGAQVWDDKTKTCIDAQSGALDDQTRFDAVRELAWAGRPDDALAVLATMTEGDSDRVLTYKGFAHRKAGRIEAGIAFYDRAIARNPDNFLARSYYGQLLVEMAEMHMAGAQLTEIRARGGRGTWAEASLARAIDTGLTADW